MLKFAIDFLIGFLVMNAMPHMLFGLFHIRFISPLGYGSQANLGFALIYVVLALLLFLWQYGLRTRLENGMVLGAGGVLLAFAVSGRFFYNLFNPDAPLP